MRDATKSTTKEQRSSVDDEITEITLRLGQQRKTPPVSPISKKWRISLRLFAGLQWLYLLGLVVVWLVLCFATDRWWFATMMAFGPRWIYPLPLIVLVPACLFLGRRYWFILLVSNLILWFPIMDFRCPWGRLFLPKGTSYHVLNCNLHNNESDLNLLKKLILRENPDFIALQECNVNSLQSALKDYHVIQSGRLLVASRFPLHEEGTVSGLEPLHTNARTHFLLCSAETPEGKLFLGSVHLPSPRYGLSNALDRNTGIRPSKKALLEEHIQLRQEESVKIASLVKKLPDPFILAGDFNTPVESDIYRTCWSSYRNAFSLTGIGFGRTFQSAVHRIPFGVRIDHILGSDAIVPSRCWVGTSVGSEHLPVLADMIRK